jgi:hypothetical protein
MLMNKRMNKIHLIAGIILLIIGQSCATKPKGRFNYLKIPIPPQYDEKRYWAALPDMGDPADLTPEGLQDRQQEARADVFFIHPTTYTNKPGNKEWNGSPRDEKLNKKTDETTIKYQASLFNGAGRVFAPRYRQAHIHAFVAKDKRSAQRALDMAYGDVKTAFEYYLEHYNDGRPIIIASHSQGTRHAKRLIKEFFDFSELKNQLVVAYLVGMPVKESEFRTIYPCRTPDETGCFCSWRTYKEGYEPKNHSEDNNIAVTNPLTWEAEQAVAPHEMNEGAVLRNFDKIRPGVADAIVNDGLLWVSKLKFPGSFFFWKRNLHIADLNLYYLNVRNNAIRRTEAFLKKNNK